MLGKRIQCLVTITIATFCTLLLATIPAASRDFNPGDPAPDFALQDANGAEFTLTSMQGKVVIVVFWRAEQKRSDDALTTLQPIYEGFKEQGVEVIAISNGVIGPEVIAKTKQSKKLTFPMLHDTEEKVYGDYGVIVAPSTFIVDKEGKLSYYYPGYRDDFSRQIFGRVEVLLGKKTLAELQAELEPPKRPETSESEKKARRYMNMGNRLMGKGMARSAMLQYEKAVKAKPDLFVAHLRLGDIYLEQKKLEKADAAFKQAAELKPHSGDAHAGQGDVLFFQGQMEKALEMLQIALKLNPKLARAHYRLGRIYEEQKQMDSALKEYKMALKILLKIEE